MKQKSIKDRLYVIILFIILLVSIIALNIYCRIIINASEYKLLKIISIERDVSDLILSETASSHDPSGYETVVNRYTKLRKKFADVLSDSEDDLIGNRQYALDDFFYTDIEAVSEYNLVSNSLNELIDSVRYIHEHHIVYLKNIMRRGYVEQNDYDDDGFQRDAEISASEVDIIDIACSIQIGLFDVFKVFSETEKNQRPLSIKHQFNHKMENLYLLINTFENYSLDAQDGILIEELLMKSREFEKAFSNLLMINQTKMELQKQIDKNADKLVKMLKFKRADIALSNKKIKKAVGILQIVSIVLMLFMVSLIIIFGKSIMNETLKTVQETEKIQRDISYKIHIDKKTSKEFKVVFNALNLMTYKLSYHTQQLQESEENYRLLIENQTDMIVKLNPEGNVIFVSPSFARTFDKAEDELLGIRLISQIHEKGRETISNVIKKVYEPPHTAYFEERFKTKDGWRWQAWLLTAVLDEQGGVDSIISTGRDVDNRKQAEEVIRKLSQAIEYSPASVIIADHQGMIEYVNPKFIELTGYSLEDVTAQTPRILDFWTLPPESSRLIWKTISSGNEWRGIFSNQKKDGEIYWESVAIAPVNDSRGRIKHYVVVQEDITERRRFEESLEEALKLAEAANLAKSEFLANMGHEIRTPMNAIIGLSHLCLATQLNPIQRDYIEKVYRSAHSLLNIINDILDFSRLEAGKLSIASAPFSLEAVLTDLSNRVNVKAHGKELEFVILIDPEVPDALMGDSLHLGQILINLTDNAVKFTEAGEIVLKTELAGSEDQTVTLRFSIKDTGIGMNPEETEKLFTAFSQADASISRKYGGTGLGLAVSKRLVEMMGGKISVESELGVGSTFHFTVSFGRQTISDTNPHQMSSRLKEFRILAADDDVPDKGKMAMGTPPHALQNNERIDTIDPEDKPAIISVLNTLKEEIDNFSASAGKSCDILLDLLQGSPQADTAIKLGKALDNYEFEKAQGIVSQMLKQVSCDVT